jgi:hypothetical protein
MLLHGGIVSTYETHLRDFGSSIKFYNINIMPKNTNLKIQGKKKIGYHSHRVKMNFLESTRSTWLQIFLNDVPSSSSSKLDEIT